MIGTDPEIPGFGCDAIGGENAMISVEKALELVLANVPEGRIERVPFQSALGCVLAETLTATINVPPFHRSSMDGFAVRAEDTTNAPTELELAGEIRAGNECSHLVRAGQAFAIMTGAPVPEGADAVQVVEQTERSNDGHRVTILKPVRQGENIALLGSEAALGETVIESGRLVGPDTSTTFAPRATADRARA